MLAPRLLKRLQIDRANDIFVWVQYVADIVRVIDNIEGEYQSSNTCIDNLSDTKMSIQSHVSAAYPLCGKKAIINPARIRAHNPPNKNGPIPEKSHLDWRVKRVSPKNNPRVINRASSTIVVS
jgi:hypothetical protein